MTCLGINRDLAITILKALADGSVETPVLAGTVGGDDRLVYGICRHLEELGLLTSRLVRGRRLLFCVDHEEVVTAETYEDHRDDELRQFWSKVRLWRLALPLKKALDRFRRE